MEVHKEVFSYVISALENHVRCRYDEYEHYDLDSKGESVISVNEENKR
jgi:hypothetical protein